MDWKNIKAVTGEIAREENLNVFTGAMAWLNSKLASSGTFNLLSGAVHAEEIYRRLLNNLYGWNLANANCGERNAAAVDLVDNNKRLAVQVTISCTRDKVRNTLAKTKMRDYARDGYRVRFVFAGSQDKGVRSGSPIPNKHRVNFDQSQDLLLTEDLIGRFLALTPTEQNTVLQVVDEELGWSRQKNTPNPATADIIEHFSDRLRSRMAYHPSFRLMEDIDKDLFPKGVIPDSARTVLPDEGEAVSFGEFIRASWESGVQCHLLLTGEGGVGKTVTMLTLATEEGFLPRNVAAIYVPLYELSQYCDKGATKDCVDRFIASDFANEDAVSRAKRLAMLEWRAGPNLILLMDGYNEVPVDRRRAVDEGLAKWASWPGVQVITTSRDIGAFGVPHLRRLELLPLSPKDVVRYLGTYAPRDSKMLRVIRTPLMLRLYERSVAFGQDQRVKRSKYIQLANPDSAGSLVWNYLQWEISRCAEERMGNLSKETYAAATLLVAPYVCWRMEEESRFSVGWDELEEYAEDACRYWRGKTKPSGFNRMLRRMMRYMDDTDLDSLVENTLDALANEIALFVEVGAGYALMHQDFRDCLAALHVRNTMEAAPAALPSELRSPLSRNVTSFIADLASENVLGLIWTLNKSTMPTHPIATNNLVAVVHQKRDGDLTALDWSEMNLTAINLFEYRHGKALELSRNPAHFCSTQLNASCFMPQGHSDYVTSICYSPDGHLLASSSADGTVIVWDMQTRRPALPPLAGGGKRLGCVCFSASGRLLASASDDGMVYVWDVTTGHRSFPPLQGHTDGVTSVCFSPNDLQIASGSTDGTVCLWDSATGTSVFTFQCADGEEVWAVAFSGDGESLAFGSSTGAVYLMDVTRKPSITRTLHGGQGLISSICFSTDERLLASGSHDGTVCIWDMPQGKLREPPFLLHRGRVNSVRFSPGSHRLASASNDGTVLMWNALDGKLLLPPLLGHGGWVRSVCFSPCGQYLASGSSDGFVRIWDAVLGSMAVPAFASRGGWNRAVCFSTDGRHVASGSDDGIVRIWDAGTGTEATPPLMGHDGRVTTVCFSPSGQVVASGAGDGRVCFWDADDGGQAMPSIKIDGCLVLSTCFSPDGRTLAIGCSNRLIRLWDMEDREFVGLPLAGHASRVRSVAFSPDGVNLVSGSGDGTVRLWDVVSGTPTTEPMDGHGGKVWTTCFSPDGRFVASGHSDGTIRVWDAKSGEPTMPPIDGHGGRVLTLCFSPDGSMLASGSADGTIRLWNVAPGKVGGRSIEGHRGGVWSVCFAPKGDLIASGSADGTIRLWDAKSGDMLRKIEPLFSISVFGLDFSIAEIPAYDKEVLRQNGVRTDNTGSSQR